MTPEERFNYLYQRAIGAEIELTRWRILALSAVALAFGEAILWAATIIGGAQ